MSDGVDVAVLHERAKQRGRLAAALNVPAEVVRLGGINHWYWVAEESRVALREALVGWIVEVSPRKDGSLPDEPSIG